MQQQLLRQQQLRGPQLRQPQQPCRAVAPAGPRRSRLACYARRTVRGGDSGRNTSTTLNRPDKGRGSSSSSSSSNGASSSAGGKASSAGSKKAPLAAKQPAPASQNGKSGRSNGAPRKQQQSNSPSQLEAFMRNTPGFNRFLDGILIFGDAVMVLATELSSERLPIEQAAPLAGVAVASWVLAGAALGDYAMQEDPDANPLSDALGWPIFVAVVNAMVTWAVALVVSLFGYSWLVSNFVVEPEMVLEVARDGQLSPQLEVCVALLITMSCWRGTAARLRL